MKRSKNNGAIPNQDRPEIPEDSEPEMSPLVRELSGVTDADPKAEYRDYLERKYAH